jgi:hypothetical protein
VNENDKPQEDKYGNLLDEDGSIDRLIFCCFPDCGCDGARLCDAENGASDRAIRHNIERKGISPA